MLSNRSQNFVERMTRILFIFTTMPSNVHFAHIGSNEVNANYHETRQKRGAEETPKNKCSLDSDCVGLK